MIKFLSNVKKTKYERTRTPQGKLLFSIVGAFAEFERSLIQERVKLGLRRAVANGTKLGRPKLEVNKYQVLNMRNQGMSYRQIAKQLNISHVSINNLLKC
jgi:DNA invertase Pin-like site-specific DNA recombinase